MKKILVGITALFLIAATIAFAAKPGGEPSTGTGEYTFVGFSTATVNGGVGPWGMNQACQGDFGPQARMANTKEIVEATIFPEMTSQWAWVRPEIKGVVETSNNTYAIDYTGSYPLWHQLTCESWRVTSGSGAGITPSGALIVFACTNTLQVSCSAPQ